MVSLLVEKQRVGERVTFFAHIFPHQVAADDGLDLPEFWYTIPFLQTGSAQKLELLQTCVWVDENYDSGENNILVLRATKKLAAKLRRFTQNRNSIHSSVDIHRQLLRFALHEWADCLQVALFYTRLPVCLCSIQLDSAATN